MTKTSLKEYFPLLRTREEVMSEIRNNPKLMELYNERDSEDWEEFFDFCTGAKGVKMLYDAFFKEVFNPEYAPERLSDFLSVILNQKVRILQILPNDTTRIADESSLLITDIVVELEDGSIVNIEIQKIGYMFPGQRAACYSADLLLRQYKRIRDKKKKKFSYYDIKPVFVIVLFESSPAEFKLYEKQYVHYVKAQSNTGVEVEMLQEFCFICLDIFREKMHNEGVTDKRDAWLMFLCEDNPEYIIMLMEKYPEFKTLYEDVYQLCLNMEDIMGIFSEELRMLDRNTVQFMMDEMQKDIDKKKLIIEEMDEQIAERNEQIAERNEQIAERDEQIAERDEQIAERDEQIAERDEQIAERDEQIAELKRQLESLLDIKG